MVDQGFALVGGVEKSYDFPPHVVRVHSTNETLYAEAVEGELALRDSPWDPYTELLPMRQFLSASLVLSCQPTRSITLAGPLDPMAFWPYADTIGGSRWPGHRGGPRRGSLVLRPSNVRMPIRPVALVRDSMSSEASPRMAHPGLNVRSCPATRR